MTNLNWLDKAILWCAPIAGGRRLWARELLAYDGARSGRRTQGWLTTSSDANSEIGAALPKLRERSRDLVRNNPRAARAVEVIVSSAVGTGITPRADTGDATLNRIIDDAFARWADECDADGQLDFFGLQHLAVRSIFESGEVLVRRRIRRPEDNLAIPLQLQVLESDHLDSSKTNNLSGGVTIQGIELDGLGQRSAYWLFRAHPGAALLPGLGAQMSSKRVPASEVIHAYRKMRAGQQRGAPWLAPAMMLLRDIDEYNEAEIVRAKIQACLALFIKTSEDSPRRMGATSTEGDTNARIETLRPGMIQYGEPGEEAQAIEPKGHANYAEFTRLQDHIWSAALGMFYAQATGDLSSVNWASYRAGDRDFRGVIDAFRWLTIIPMLCRPAWNWFIEAAFLAGKIPALNYGCEWTPPPFMSIDPTKDAEADKAEIRSGLTTWPRAVAARGYNPQRQLDTAAEWFKKFDAAGVEFDCDPRVKDASGKAEGGVNGDDESSAAGPVR